MSSLKKIALDYLVYSLPGTSVPKPSQEWTS